LIAVAEEDAEQAISAVRAAGTTVDRIGSIQPPGGGVIMNGDTNGRPFPRFARDEVARFFSERANGMEGPA
jgi:hypothetical protein